MNVLSPWVDRRAVPLAGGLALGADAGAGLVLATVPPQEFDSPIYVQARSVMDLDTWGAVLLVLAVVTGLAWMAQGRCRLVGFLHVYLLGCAWWGFWTVLAALSSIGANGTSGLLPLLSSVPAALHILVGAAWPSTGRQNLLRHG